MNNCRLVMVKFNVYMKKSGIVRTLVFRYALFHNVNNQIQAIIVNGDTKICSWNCLAFNYWRQRSIVSESNELRKETLAASFKN